MEWKTVKLGEVCARLKSGKGIPSSEVHNTGKYPVIGGNGIRGYADTLNFKGECGIIGRQGAYCGNVRYFNGEAYMTEHAIVVVGDNNTNTYYLTQLLSKMQLGHLSAQSAQPGLSVQILSKQIISLPPLIYQEKVAAILSSLDDKIETNDRINRNLEAQAQALFKSWFMDFEPFGGVMPDDWREGVLGDIAEFKRGKGILGKDAKPGKIPVVAGGIEPAYYHDTANTKAPVVTISASGANAGFVRLYNEDVWASDCSWIDANSKNLLWAYCYLSMNRHILRHAQTGAVQPHVKAKDVNAFEIFVPSQEVIDDFINAIEPLFNKIANNQEENKRLAALRDTLLPKLMKGEIAL